MSTHRIERALVDWIGRFYALPTEALAVATLSITVVCYFVLPPVLGIPIVLIFGLLPWWEAGLKRRLERNQPANGDWSKR